MEILHPEQLTREGESTVSQFEKFKPVFEHLYAVKAFSLELFQAHFERAINWGVDVQPVRIDYNGRRELGCNEGLAEYHEAKRPFGTYVNDAVVLMREPSHANRYLYRAVSNEVEYKMRKIHFSYSILEIHPLGLVDFTSGLSVVENKDFDLLHTGALGPYILRPGEMNQADKHSTIIQTNEESYRSQLGSITKGFERVALSDEDFLKQTKKSYHNLCNAVKVYKPWMLEEY